MADSMSLGSAYAEITLKKSSFDAGLTSSMASLQGWHKKALKYATIALGVVGVASIVSEVKKAIKVYADFEYAMAGVKVVTNSTEQQMKVLGETAKKLGTTTKFGMTEIAQAMEQLGRAGFSTNQIVASMPGIVNLASASTMSLSAAAETAMMTLKGMGLAASDSARVADVLAAADAASAVSVEDLAESLKYITPLARAAGFSLEETVAAAAALGDAGIKGSMAGTSLRFTFSTLLESSDAFKEDLAGMGIALSELYGPDGQLKDFADVLTVFAEAGMTAGDAMKLMSDRSGVAVVNLLQNIPGLKELIKVLEGSAGAAKKIADTKMDTITGQLGLLSKKWEALRIGLIGGTEDATKDFIKNTLIPFVDSIAEWFQKQGGLVGLWERFGDAVKYVGLAFAKIAGVVVILSLVHKALTGLMNPVVWMIAAATLLYVAWETNLFGIRDAAEAAWQGIKDLFHIDDIIENLKQGNWGDAFATIAIDVAAVLGTVTIAKDFLSMVLTKTATGLGGVFNTALGAITGIGTGLALAFMLNKDKFTLENGEIDWAAFLNRALPSAVAGLIGFAIGGAQGKLLATLFTTLAFQFMPEGVGEALKRALGVAGIEEAIKAGDWGKAAATISLDLALVVGTVSGVKQVADSIMRAMANAKVGFALSSVAGVLGLAAVIALNAKLDSDAATVSGEAFDLDKFASKLTLAIGAAGLVFAATKNGLAATAAAQLVFTLFPMFVVDETDAAPTFQSELIKAIGRAVTALGMAGIGFRAGVAIGVPAGHALAGAVIGTITGLTIGVIINLLIGWNDAAYQSEAQKAVGAIEERLQAAAREEPITVSPDVDVLPAPAVSGEQAALWAEYFSTAIGDPSLWNAVKTRFQDEFLIMGGEFTREYGPDIALSMMTGLLQGIIDAITDPEAKNSVNAAFRELFEGIVPGVMSLRLEAIGKRSGGLMERQSGGAVPGSGAGDIIPAMLEPGEFVLPKWMMEIPWFAAFVRNLWGRGKKLAGGGPSYEVGVPQPGKGWLGLDPAALEAQILADLGQTVETIDSVLLGIIRMMAKGARDQQAVIALFTTFGKMLRPASEGLDALAAEADEAGEKFTAAVDGLELFKRGLDDTTAKLQEMFDAIAVQIILDYNRQVEAYTQLYQSGLTEGNAAKQFTGVAGLQGVYQAMAAALELFKKTGTGTAEATATLTAEMAKLAETYGFTTEEVSEASKTWAERIAKITAEMQGGKLTAEEYAGNLQELMGLYETISSAIELLTAKGFSEGAAELQALLADIVAAGGAPLPDPNEAKRAATEAAQAAQEAFMAQFGQVATSALASGDWEAAAQEASRMAADFERIAAEASALPTAEGVEPISRATVLSSINAIEDEVLSLMKAELARLEKVDLAEAEGLAKRIKAIEDANLTLTEIEQKRVEAAQVAEEGFWDSFKQNALMAFEGGDWKGAFESIRALAKDPTPLREEMARLNEAHGLKLQEIDLLREIIGLEADLVGVLDLLISEARQQGEWAEVERLEAKKEWIERQLKTPRERAQGAVGEWGPVVTQAAGMFGSFAGQAAGAGVGLVSGLLQGGAAAASGILGVVELGIDAVKWVAEKAKEAAEELRKSVEETAQSILNAGAALAQSFVNLVTQSEAYRQTMEFLTSLMDQLFSGFLGPLADLFGEILSVFEVTVEETKKVVETVSREIVGSLNVPYGWKALNRIRYGASFTGEPPVFGKGETQSATETLEEETKKVADIVREFGTQIEWIKDSIIKLKARFDVLWDAIRPALGAAAVEVTKAFIGALDTILVQLTAYAPNLSALVAAIGDVLTAAINGLLPVVTTLIDGLFVLADFFVKTISPDLQAFFKNFGEWWKTEMDPFLQAEVFPKLREVLEWLWAAFKDLWNFLGPKVMPLLKDLWAIVEEAWDNAIKPMLEQFSAWVKDNWPLISDFLKNQLTLLLQSIGEKIGKALEYAKIKIQDGGGDAAAALKSITESQTFSFFEKISLLWQTKSTTLWDKLTTTATLAWKGFTDGVEKFWNLLNGRGWNTNQELTGSAPSSETSSPSDSVTPPVAATSSDIPLALRQQWWQQFHGSLAGFPGYAVGGFVSGPVGAPQLAVVHGGEYVIPAGGGAAGGPIHIHVQVGTRDIGEMVLKDLKRSNAVQFGAALNPIGGY